MSFDTQEKPWICSPSSANLLLVGSIIRDMREPCLQYSPVKGSRVLRPERWCASFDDNGRIVDFNKALRFIMLGGVDPSIRAEVWEFLIGCYAVGSTAEYRKQLRIARRERYNDLIKQCQQMHSSVGTGTLAYAVGSKVMDVRNQSKDENSTADDIFGQVSQEDPSESLRPTTINSSCASTLCANTGGLCSSLEIAYATESPDHAVYDSSNDSFSYTVDLGDGEPSADSYFDFPALPVTNLFNEVGQNMVEEDEGYRISRPQKRKMHNDCLRDFPMNVSADLTVEDSPSIDVCARVSSYRSSNFEAQGQQMDLKDFQWQRISLDRSGASYDQDITTVTARGSCRMIDDDRRVRDWLWTLHRIVVDVVRTDNHLEFYGDTKNVARMSDILAVYAWVDPSTGYCQGMSDLLSPFVVLYEDNADAFWCFEMLLRRMRENFHMEGPTGVLKQLEGLGRILELTDLEMSRHLSAIGAESYLFAFRMLLVLFRRELSFDAALNMWEMLWAVDFDEAMLHELADSCPEPPVLQLAVDDTTETNEKNNIENSRDSLSYQTSLEKHVSRNDDTNSDSIIPFCGFRPTIFLTRNLQNNAPVLPLVRNRDDELAVFCVASILIVNRTKIMKQAHSMDDIIKMVNDNKLQINVRKCVRMAIRLRKKVLLQGNEAN